MNIILQEVTVPGCVDCARFKKLWADKMRGEFPAVEFQEISAVSPEGQALVAQHGIMASPGIIINGELFSVGPVNENGLRAKLKELSG